MTAKKTLSELLRGQKRFGRLTLIGKGEPLLEGNGVLRTRALLRCDCGQLATCTPSNLRGGHTQSCGCFRVDSTRRAMTRHGSAIHGSRPSEYVAWQGMLNRCRNQNERSWKDYGGRGIKVCDEWQGSFERFLADVGPKPGPHYSIDRIDVNGNYKPGNVRWATAWEQARNKTTTAWVTYQGVRMSVIDACSASGINYGSLLTLAARYKQPMAQVFNEFLSGKRSRPRANIRELKRALKDDTSFHASQRSKTVGVPGVTWDRQKHKFLVQYRQGEKLVSKRYETFEEACAARLALEQQLGSIRTR